MRSLKLNDYPSLISLVNILFFITCTHSATAEDWECEDIHSNISLIKVNSDPNNTLSGSWTGGAGTNEECGIIGSLIDTTPPAHLAFAIPQEHSALSLEINLDVSQLHAQNLHSVSFAAVEIGSGYGQTSLVKIALRTSNNGLEYQIEAVWYTAGVISQIDQLSAIATNSLDTALDIEFLWLNQNNQSSAQITVTQSLASSNFTSNQNAIPSLVKLGIIESSVSGNAGDFWISGANLQVN